MAKAAKGGFGSAIGCLLVLAALGAAGWRFGPELLAFVRGSAATVEWGSAHEGDGLRVRVKAAAVEITGIEDALGSREGSLDLHVTLEITNMGDAPLTYKTPRLLRASEPKLVDDQGREAHHVAYGDEAAIEGQLDDGEQIQPHDKETHDLVFKEPPPGAKSFLLKLDLGILGRSGVVQFKIPASEVKGLR